MHRVLSPLFLAAALAAQPPYDLLLKEAG